VQLPDEACGSETPTRAVDADIVADQVALGACFVGRVSPENALFPRNTRCKISHCQNFDLKTSFMNVISYLWCNEGEFAPTRETRLALSFDSNLFGFVT
jgi:hypothetical protein